MSGSLSVPPPVSGLHFVEIVHAARWLDKKSCVGPAVAIAVVSHTAIVREGAGRLAIKGVTVTCLPRRGSGTGSCNKREYKNNYSFWFNKL